jgi:hypothetical protein
MSTALRLAPTLLLSWLLTLSLACNDPVDPNRERILGYMISGQADGTDPSTGEALACAFIITQLATGGPLVGGWTGTTTIRVIRVRSGATQSVTYDTTLVAQPATITVPDSSHIQFSVSGPFTVDLSADMAPASPGYGQGDWTCEPGHPLGRVQPDATLVGRWNIEPILDLPIG